MAYGTKLDFSTGNVTDPFRAAAPYMKQAGDIFSGMAERKAKAKTQAILDAREAREVEKYATGIEQDKELASVLGGLSDRTTRTTTIPGGSNQAVINAQIADNAEKRDMLEKSILTPGDKYSKLFEQYSRQPSEVAKAKAIDSIADNTAILESGSDDPGLMAKPAYGQFFGEARDAISNMFSGWTKTSGRDPEVLARQKATIAESVKTPKQKTDIINALIPTASRSEKYGIEDAHIQAMKESGLQQAVDDLSSFTGETVPELVTTKSKTSTKNVQKTRSEFVKDAMASIRGNDKLTGSTMLMAMAKLDTVADGIYGKPKKSMTFGEELRFEKYKYDQAKEKKSVTGIKKMYPKAPKSITTMEEMKAYITKNKSKTSGGHGGTEAISMMTNLGIDTDHRRKLFAEAERYGVKDKDLSNLMSAYNEEYTLIPRLSGNVTDDVIQYIRDTYELKV